jgi:hypothetical protein
VRRAYIVLLLAETLPSSPYPEDRTIFGVLVSGAYETAHNQDQLLLFVVMHVPGPNTSKHPGPKLKRE